jgi:hypothetical protein
MTGRTYASLPPCGSRSPRRSGKRQPPQSDLPTSAHACTLIRVTPVVRRCLELINLLVTWVRRLKVFFASGIDSEPVPPGRGNQ